jgi:SAM-dependent methyltransferase
MLPIDTRPVFKRVMQVVCDLARRPLADLRVLDLGSAHGQYAIELAHRGARVLGIEGREAWLEAARDTQQKLSLSSVSFVQDDVRNLSAARYGQFDVVLCLGILYHLDAPDVFDFVGRLFEVCGDFVVIETHVALAPVLSHEWRGKRYWGAPSREHPAGATPEEKLKNVAASLDNEESFWLTPASLCNLLRHAGFTSVYDCRNPIANLYVGPQREFKIWENRMTLVAVKGRPVDLGGGPEADWPESLKEHFFSPSALDFSTACFRLHVLEDEHGKG